MGKIGTAGCRGKKESHVACGTGKKFMNTVLPKKNISTLMIYPQKPKSDYAEYCDSTGGTSLYQFFSLDYNTVSTERKYTLAAKSSTQNQGGLEEK